jgi:NAD(P)-dependent dehydrogenase (short-subunit alcohol dehydrogenase family)
MSADDLVKTPSKVYEGFRMGLPSAKGKTFAVTGTTSGTGYVCARDIVSTGGRVLALNRPSERAAKALASLESLCEDGGSVVQIDCDLSRLQSAADASKVVQTACEGSLDALVCNAGIGLFPDQRSADGYEYQMQCNHLSHWLLIRALTPCLEKAAGAKGEARVVLHSSGAALSQFGTGRIAPLDACYLGKEALPADGVGDSNGARARRYQQSKLVLLVAGTALSEELVASGSAVKVLMANPGAAATGFVTASLSGSSLRALLIKSVWTLAKRFVNTMEEGAMPLVKCVLSDEVHTGEFWSPKRLVKGSGGKSKPVMRSLPVLQTKEVLVAERGPDAWELVHGEETKKMAVGLSDLAVKPFL